MQSQNTDSAKGMSLRCSRRCFGYYRLGVTAVTVLFLLGYITGSLLRQDPFGKRWLLPNEIHKPNVEGISDEAADDEGEKAKQEGEYVSSLKKTWLTWNRPTIDIPGVYRACVKRPKPAVINKVITGELVLQERADKMTIEACLDSCIQLGFTYAALSRGHECYCTDLSSTSQFISYVDSSLCDIPCTGDHYHNCGGRNVMSVYRTSVPDARCSSIKLGTPGSLPLIALASYPRSGNSWTRQLIQKATGIYTGSIYFETEGVLEFARRVFQGGTIDYKGKSTICVKTHISELGHVDQFEGAILLIRNPYRSLVSEAFRRKLVVSNMSSENVIRFFKSEGGQSYINQEIDNWKVMQLRWMKMQRRFLPIVYEELEADTVRKLTEIVVFLNQTVEHERIVCATQDHPSSRASGTFHDSRGGKGRMYLTKDPFTTRLHKKIDDSIKLVNDTLFKIHKKVLPAEYLKTIDFF